MITLGCVRSRRNGSFVNGLIWRGPRGAIPNPEQEGTCLKASILRMTLTTMTHTIDRKNVHLSMINDVWNLMQPDAYMHSKSHMNHLSSSQRSKTFKSRIKPLITPYSLMHRNKENPFFKNTLLLPSFPTQTIAVKWVAPKSGFARSQIKVSTTSVIIPFRW